MFSVTLQTYLKFITVDLLILARYRDRTVSVTKFWNQIANPIHTLSNVPLIYN